MRNVHVRLYKPIAGLLAISLWVISVAIAIAQIVVIRELVMRLYTFVLTLSGAVLDVHGAEFWAGVSLQNFLVVLLAMGVVAFVVAVTLFIVASPSPGPWRSHRLTHNRQHAQHSET